MAYPTIRELAAELRVVQQQGKQWAEEDGVDSDDGEGVEVRLQVVNGSWCIRTGDASYDDDHRGTWSVGFVPLTRFSSYEMAREMIREARNTSAF
jgi:hypothetical protein